MSSIPSVRQVYDENARSWVRTSQVVLSDFTGRPAVLEELGDLRGAHVLDLGCGEGYVARLIADAGAASVHGIDVSAEMVAKARAATPPISRCAFSFAAGDATTANALPRDRFDRIIAVFMFNYVSCRRMRSTLEIARAHLGPGGRFVFSVPHPCFPFMREPASPFYFEPGSHDYFSGVDAEFEGHIWRRDGASLPVRCVHKTVSDYFDAIAAAGWPRVPKVRELRVTAEHVALDPGFFSPLLGYPLHMLFRLEA
jgi:cyclopropane fatty-acyl-phospholipid synthase-like methyltransferase